MTIEPVTQPVLGGCEPETMQLQVLQDENRLLFEQLRVVQEELERFHYQPQAIADSVVPTVIQIAPVDERLIQIEAENIRYAAMLEVQGELNELQARYALSSRLGNILIEGTRSAGAFFSVPRRLHRVWKQNRHSSPPAALGGKSFDKVIQTYQQGGQDQVQELLSRTAASSAVQANAWTALARTLMETEPAVAASMASRAYALEPRGFRQKWLAFRFHEAGDFIKAEAWLALLPEDVPFTESETRHKERLLKQAVQYRQEQARLRYEVDTQQEQVQFQWEKLAQARDTLAGTVEQQRAQLASLHIQVQKLDQERVAQMTVAQELRVHSQWLEQELAQLRQDRGLQIQRADELQAHIQALAEETKIYKQTSQEQGVLLEQQEQERISLKQSIEDLQQSVRDEKEQVTQWFEQCRILQAGLAEAFQERDRLQMLEKQHDEQNISLLTELESLTLRHDEQQFLVAQKQNECESLRLEVSALESRLQEYLELLDQEQKQHAGLQTQFASLSESHEYQQGLLSQKQSEYEALGLDVAALQLRLDEKTELLEREQQQNEFLQSELDALGLHHEEQQALAAQAQSECEALALDVSASQLKFEEQAKLLEQTKQQAEAAQRQVESLLADQERISALRTQEHTELLSVQTALEALKLACAEQTQLAAQRLERCESIQMELNAMTTAHAEQAALAAQRQGELLQQGREQLSLEKARAALENKQRELEQKLVAQIEREAGLIQDLSKQVQGLAARDLISPETLQGMLTAQAEELARAHRQIELAVQKNSLNTARQIQSFVSMQEYFATGVLPAFNSESHSWPVSADFALCLMQRLVLEQYDLVIEFGSGMSTVIVARTLALIAERQQTAAAHFISFDHLEPYYQQTLGYLKQAGLEQGVQLTLAPLKEWQGADGQTYPYYSCQTVLAQLAKQKKASRKRILVIVDGPPAATGPKARYPAGPIVMQYFPDAHIDFLMDDFIRQDEKEVAKHWQRDVKAAGLLSAVRNFKLEKDACLITVHPKDSK